MKKFRTAIVFASLLFGAVVVDCTAMKAQTTRNDSAAQIQQDDTSTDFSHDSFWKAARNGDLEHVRAALESGFDVNVKTNYGATALFFACDRGQVEVAKFLLEHDADPNIKDTFYNATPLAWAQMKGNSRIDHPHHYLFVKQKPSLFYVCLALTTLAALFRLADGLPTHYDSHIPSSLLMFSRLSVSDP